MTTEQAAGAALAVRPDQTEWTANQLAAFKQLGMDGAPEGDRAVFLHRCQVTGLDPFAKQIRLRKDREQADGEWQDRWSIETGIEGYRVIAARAAKRDGVTLDYGEAIWYDADGREHTIWLGGSTPPAAASFTVFKDGKPVKGKVTFSEFAKIKNGNLLANWRTMPAHMIAKCAEALALRMAFPQDLEGIQTADETPYIEPQLTVTQVHNPAPARVREPRPGNVADLRQKIRAEFDRLSLDDHEERGVYVNKLANKPADAPLTELGEADLEFALDSLKDCEDIGALNDLCAVEAS